MLQNISDGTWKRVQGEKILIAENVARHVILKMIIKQKFS